MRFKSVILLFLFTIWFCNELYASSPMLKGARAGSGFEVTLSGKGFGKDCRQCEVIVDYGKGQRYAAKTLAWSATSIKAVVPDVGIGERVKLTVRTSDGESSAISYKIRPILTPKKNINRTVKPNATKGLGVHSFIYNAKLGGRGKDTISVGVDKPDCDEEAWAFERGNIVFNNKRFGDAKIASSPKAGCSKCKPMVVKWYHEPTGKIDYQVHIYKRKIVGACSSLKR